MKVGDLVTRKSHGHDITFKIISINPDGSVRLKGHHWRLEADAPLGDLQKQSFPNSKDSWLQTRMQMVLTNHRPVYRPRP